jgi:hypothetical protein
MRPAPTTLVEHQQAVAAAIQQLLNGPSRRREREAFVALRAGYEAALRGEAERLVHHRFAATGDETTTRSDLVRLIAGSVTEIVGDAHRDHYETSFVERVRHFFELTNRRRLAAALLNALLFGAVTAVAVQTVEAIPSVNNTRALATGAGVVGFALRYVRPRLVVRALLGASGSRIKERARAGVNKHPGDVLHEIRQEVADIQDRELRRHIRYELLAERHYGPMVRVALSDALLDVRLSTPREQDHAVTVAVGTAVEWLYALYGIDLTV